MLRFYADVDDVTSSATTREEAETVREKQKAIQNDFNDARKMIDARVQFLQK